MEFSLTTKAAPIAVVGMALRVPGASTPEQFWRNITDKLDTIARVSRDELRGLGVPDVLIDDPRFVPAKPILSDIEYFDAAYFGMTPFDAERTDRGHRMFLECAVEALERAGIVAGPNGPVTGVFGGCGGMDYLEKNLSRMEQEDEHDPAVKIALRLGNQPDFLPCRVSFKLGLCGPSFAVEAACATSLLAVYLGADSLRRGECDIALAGGANIDLPNRPGYVAGVDGMLSTGGVVRPFDENSDGTMFGSGVGVVVLKRLDDALRDGDHIQAVILGTATNNDGAPADKASFVAPSAAGQKIVVSRALSESGIDPRTIGYVEAHGTGTRLGDPIEVQALTEVYRTYTQDKGYCALGSVKANVGHLRSAAGIVSFIKTCLALEYATLPPVTHVDQLNSQVDFANSPFFLPQQPQHWANGVTPRRAAVSAFGFGGSNVHLILEQAPHGASDAAPAPESELLVLSAQTERALERRIRDLDAHLGAHPDLPLGDVAHTLRVGRQALPARAAFVARRGEDTAPVFEPQLSGTVSAERPVVFIFPGQGAQRPGMGRAFYETEPVYRAAIDECTSILQPMLGLDLKTLLHADGTEAEPFAAEELRQTKFAQPALFTVGYAMAQLMVSKGVTPSAMIGHSIGEYVAACIAGVFSLADALHLVSLRARLMQACEPGSMLAVFLPEADVRARMGTLEIAAVNAPTVSVVSGSIAAIAAFAAELSREGVGHRLLLTSHAFHSSMIAPAVAEYRTALAATERHAPTHRVISNLTGAFLTADEAVDPDYWAGHMRHAVRFADGVATALRLGNPLFLELGPRTLSNLFAQFGANDSAIAAIDGTKPGNPGPYALQETVGWLWCRGAAIDWRRYESGRAFRSAVLPTYPFQRQRYWVDPAGTAQQAASLHVYDVEWRPQTLGTASVPLANGIWLLFMDELGLGDAIAKRLAAQSARVLKIHRGDRFFADANGIVHLRPGNRADLDSLLVLPLIASGTEPLHIVHLWGVTGAAGPHNSVEAFDRIATDGFHTLLALIQAASDLGRLDGLRMVSVVDSLIVLEGENGPLHAEKAVLMGPARTIPQELAGVTARCLDLPLFAPGDPPAFAVDAVLNEILTDDPAPVAALRPHGRYVDSLVQVSKLPLGRLRLRESGTVFITGGLGGLGLEVARDLYEAVGANAVLVSRWALPPRATWPEVARRDDKVGHVVAKLLALEDAGAKILVAVADAADAAAMARAVAQAEAHFGAIDAVVHLAGIVADEAALTKRPEIVEAVFGAKVRGAFILEQLFEKKRLDFLVLFSSIASQIPGRGNIDYSGANAVLDALAKREGFKDHGLRCSLGWDAWQNVGMAARWAERFATTPRRAGGVDRRSVAEPVEHPLIQTRLRAPDGTIVYRGILDPQAQWVLDQHRFAERALLPGMGIVVCVRAAYADFMGVRANIELSDVAFRRPLFVDEAGHEMFISFTPDRGRHRFEVRSVAPSGAQKITTTGHASLCAPDPKAPAKLRPLVANTRMNSFNRFSGGAHWAPPRIMEESGDLTLCELELPSSLAHEVGGYGLHPGHLDRATWIPGMHHFTGGEASPLAIDSMKIYADFTRELFVQGRRRFVGGALTADVEIRDAEGRLLVDVTGYTMRQLGKDGFGSEDDEQQPRCLSLRQPGDLRSLALEPMARPQPGPGQVLIEVKAAGLNFRDVLTALGEMPFPAGATLGGECSGVVTAVGERVEGLTTGDAVITFAAGSFASHVVADARLVSKMPPALSFEDGAGLPIVFLTAEYALKHLAQLRRGERILIHAAAGGVGLAAVQIARNLGAEIYATAGSDEKRDYLRSVGVRHVFDSRSLGFADDVMAATGSQGVDVVLNSLGGEFIQRGLDVLRTFGRFVEIGKRDILANAPMGLSPFIRNLGYFAFDLAIVRELRPDLTAQMLQDVLDAMAKGELSPLPTYAVPLSEAPRAFEHMARARHIGKVVLTLHDGEGPAKRELTASERFAALYGSGVGLADGLQKFRHLLSSDETPHHVVISPRNLGGSVPLRKPAGFAANRARRGIATAYTAPTTHEENVLVQIWQDMLGVDSIGIDDDFIALGGNSITALQILYGVRREFGVRLPATAIFQNPTVARFAAVMRDAAAGDAKIAALARELTALDGDTAARLLAEARS
jgi:acyl transferase domain-containing protein/NADPH:quinone reductase-like Zn-dependent oxidoreductase